MKNFINAVKWDLILQVKYQIVTIAAVITIIYSTVFLTFNIESFNGLLIFLILSDPSFLGFMFVGALVLFDKSANTWVALVVTPLTPRVYLWSKALSLTIIAVPCTFAMALSAKGFHFNILYLFLSVSLTSIIFIFLGFVGAARVKTLNQYLIVMGNFLIPFFLPFLNYFGLTDTWIFYIIPTQASIFLMEAAFSEIAGWQLIYSLICLLIWIFLSYLLAVKSYQKYLVAGG